MTPESTHAATPPTGIERVRLWLSYQRYALLLFALALAPAAAVAAFAPRAWWAWLVAALVGVKIGRFAIEVYGRWPRKLRATAAADQRIASGRFEPGFVSGYCGDPCFRVVAREILRRAGIERRERRALTQRFAAEARQRGQVLLLVDPETGAQTLVGGSADELRSHVAEAAR